MSTVINQPKTNFALIGVASSIANTAHKVLIVGQSFLSGTESGELFENIGNGGDENTLFREDSPLAEMIRAFKIRNQQVRVDAIAIKETPATQTTDPNAEPADSSFELSFSASGQLVNNVVTVTIGNSEHKYSVPVIEGDIPDDIETRLFDAINADSRAVVIPALIRSNQLDDGDGNFGVTRVMSYKAKNQHPNVNYIFRVEFEVDDENLEVTRNIGTADFTVPDLDGVFDSVQGQRYQTVVWPYPFNLDPLTSFLDPRFNKDGVVIDGVGVTALNQTFQGLLLFGEAQNSASLVMLGGNIAVDTIDGDNDRRTYQGGDIPENPLIKACHFAAIRSLRLDDQGANIADLVVGDAGLDAFGGAALASRPYFNTPFSSLPLSESNRGFESTEIEQLLEAGITVLGNNIAGNQVILGETVTTYKTDTAGNPDETFRFLNYVDTSSGIREYFYNNFRARFAQSRLTEGDLVLGRKMANANLVRSFAKRLYVALSGQDFVLTESGEDALNFFDENLFVSVDKAQGIVTIIMTVPIVTQYRETRATIRISFSINS